MTTPLIAANDAWSLWAVIAGCAALCVWLETSYRWAAKVSGCVLALLMAMVLSNLGVIPTDAPVYDTVWGYIVPLALPPLLFNSDLRRIVRDSGRMLVIFLIGSAGTVAGAIIGYCLLSGYIPELRGIAGMMTGTYIGGSLNLAALSQAFGVSGAMSTAAVVADNLTMALYFFVLMAIPSVGLFKKLFRHPYIDQQMAQQPAQASAASGEPVQTYWVGKEISLRDIAFCCGFAFIIVALAVALAKWLAAAIPTGNAVLDMANSMLGNKYLWIATVTVVFAAAFPKFFGSIKGAHEIGTYLIYFFFFVIGAPASVKVIIENSPLLFVFTALIVSSNMVVMFVMGCIMKIDLETIILASNANIGGPTTAAGMAIAKGWNSLVAPTLLVGTLGYVIGTYLGLLVGNLV